MLETVEQKAKPQRKRLGEAVAVFLAWTVVSMSVYGICYYIVTRFGPNTVPQIAALTLLSPVLILTTVAYACAVWNCVRVAFTPPPEGDIDIRRLPLPFDESGFGVEPREPANRGTSDLMRLYMVLSIIGTMGYWAWKGFPLPF